MIEQLKNAYLNEVALARHIQLRLYGYENVIPFKPMLMWRIKSSVPNFYKILIIFLPIVSLLLVITQFVLLTFPIRRPIDRSAHLILETTGESKYRIKAALNLKEERSLVFLKRPSIFLYLSFKERVWVFISCVSLVFTFIKSRNLLLLTHAYDSPFLCAMLQLVTRQGAVTTDDQVQRWIFLFSHRDIELTCVQHGYIDADFEPPHCFGSIKNLHALDNISVNVFEKLFFIHTITYFSRTISPKEYEKEHTNFDIYFLASSHPFFRQEKDFIRTLKSNVNKEVKLYFKFHPAHKYGIFEKLWVYRNVDRIIPIGEYPKCDFLVSYNSAITELYCEHDVKLIDLSWKQ